MGSGQPSLCLLAWVSSIWRCLSCSKVLKFLFRNWHQFLFFSRRGKRTPSSNRCHERHRLARCRQHKANLAVEEEHLHDIAVENESEPSLSATPWPSPPLPPPLPQRMPVPPPRAVRRLTMDNQQPGNRLTPRRRGRRARSASQARWSRKRRHSPLSTAPSTGWRSTSGKTGHSTGTTTGSATSRGRTSPTDSDGPSPYPTPLAAPRKDQYIGLGLRVLPSAPAPPAIAAAAGYAHQERGALCAQGQWVTELEGRLRLCYYATWLQEGCPHDGYACFNMRDILWPRLWARRDCGRVRFHIELMRRNL